MKINVFEVLQNWYLAQCDGDWEHEFGIKIDTLDNPGWTVVIDITNTNCMNKEFAEVNRQISENNWTQCRVKNGQFCGAGGPQNLERIIEIFIDWCEDPKNLD